MFPKFGILFLLLAGLALARDIPQVPVQTLTSPTLAPASAITPAPLAHEDVFKRAIGTCGFIRGDSGIYSLPLNLCLAASNSHPRQRRL